MGWEYAEDFIWPYTDTLYIYPTSITVTSTGPAAEKHPALMGLYNKDDEVANLRPVYKKTDGDYFIFYNSKLYFIMVITGSVVFIIAGVRDWMIGPDFTAIGGWIHSDKRGLLTIPTSGWKYWDGNDWLTDPDLMFT